MTQARPTVAELVPLLAPAQILLVGRTGWISRLIEDVTDSPWSHVALIDDTLAAVWVVVEATVDVKGVAARRLEVILDDPTVVRLALLDPLADLGLGARDKVMQAAWLMTGLPYSTDVNLRILLNRPVDPADAERYGVNCAELCALAYHQGLGRDLIDLRRPTPAAFAEAGLPQVWAWQAPVQPPSDPPRPHEQAPMSQELTHRSCPPRAI